MANDADNEPTTAKQRSPAFPYISLEQALERVKIIYDKVKDHPQNREQISKAYGKPSTSSATIQTLATLQQYGLLETVVVNGERRLRVSALAKTMLHPHAPKVQYEFGLQRAALMPPVFKELWERYRDLEGLSDGVPIFYLSHDREAEHGTAFTEGAAKDVVRIYRATLAFAGIQASDSTASSEEAVDEWEDANPASNRQPYAQEFAMPEPQIEQQINVRPPAPLAPPPGSRADTCNIPEGVVTLSFPEEFSQASLEDIEAWLDFQKNRLKRWVKAN